MEPPQLPEADADASHCGSGAARHLPAVDFAEPARKTGPHAAVSQVAYLPRLRAENHASVKSGSVPMTPSLARPPQYLASRLEASSLTLRVTWLLSLVAYGLAPACHSRPCQAAGLVARQVGQVHVRGGGVQLARRGRELVPGLRDLDAVLVEDVLPVEHAHRAGVLRDGPDLAARAADLTPGPVDELVLQRGRAVRSQVQQAVGDRERRDVLELDLRHVRRSRTGLQRGAHLGVVRQALAGVDHLDLDGRVLLGEERDLLGDVGDPGPERQFRRGRHRLVDVGLADRPGGGLAGAGAVVTAGGEGGAERHRGRRGEEGPAADRRAGEGCGHGGLRDWQG